MSLGRKIKQWRQEHGYESAVRSVAGAIKNKTVDPSRISVLDLAVNLVGDDWADKMERANANPFTSPFLNPDAYRGMESNADAVDAATFSAITGNLLIDRVRAGYDAPGFIGDSLVETIPVTHGNLDTIREPWLGEIGNAPSLLSSLTDDDEDVLEEGEPVSASGFLPNYVVLGRPKLRERACHLTMQMIYADRTRQAYQRAESVGKRIRRNKEYRILKVVAGVHNNYTFSVGGAAEVTACTYIETNASTNPAYLSGNGWVNHLDSNPLNNWSDLNEVEQLFAQMRDPNTNEPIDVDADTILVMPSQVHNAKHVLFSTNIRSGPGGSTSTDNTLNSAFDATNTIKPYNLITSKYLYRLMTQNVTTAWLPSQDYFNSSNGGTLLSVTAAIANGLWWVGNFKKAFYYREAMPFRAVQAPPMNPREFDRNIVLSVKAGEWGVAGVQDPRYVVRCSHTTLESQTD